ncbi:glycine cleavage system protein GcvH [Salinispirillum sp. LH 10-3-1]|uniref:Glycine cleavage system H protein n=1 Tax=Salinispirillum sp. LH 10-3-1 TaxID=2952525 RepID=A0AB38YH10_9GAMM
MSNAPADRKYTATHEWLKADTDGVYLMGITDHAQELLGDIVFVELPEEGREVAAGEEIAVIESVKAASDIYAPVAGTIVAVNEALTDSPDTVNDDAHSAGWILRLQPSNAADVDALLSADDYTQSLAD